MDSERNIYRSMKKRILSNIYLKNGAAVAGRKDFSPIGTEPGRLALQYANRHVDGLLVYDLSENDGEHEKNLDALKEICEKAEIPVIGASATKRMEDIKKLLYAGCKQAVLDYHDPEAVDITEEVSLKFGKEKLLVKADDIDTLRKEMSRIEQYASAVLLEQVSLQEAVKLSLFSSVPYYAELSVGEAVSAPSIEDCLTLFSQDLCQGMTGFEALGESALALKDAILAAGLSIDCLQAQYQWSDFKLNSDGMVPVIVQDYQTQEVLMMAYMNEEAYLTTLKTGKMTYYSRSRQELWLKGDTSGHYQYVKGLTADCDMDTILAKVSQIGAACHTGAYSCFFHDIAKTDFESKNPFMVFEEVFAVIQDRKLHPKEGSYTNYLFDKGIDKILKKLGEEATEIVIASKNPNANEIKYEICDFLYHMMVLMAEKDITWEEITKELAKR